jgi:hypothetical protein
MTPHIFVHGDQYFGGTCCLNVRGRRRWIKQVPPTCSIPPMEVLLHSTITHNIKIFIVTAMGTSVLCYNKAAKTTQTINT